MRIALWGLQMDLRIQIVDAQELQFVRIPQYSIGFKKRISDHLSVYTAELVAIFLALNWLDDNSINGNNKALIASDSQAAIVSIKSGKSCRLDILFKIYHLLFKLYSKNLTVCFLWVPAHVGVVGNQDVDILAKQALNFQTLNMNVPLSKVEGKAIIKKKIVETWQLYWDIIDTGRHLYNIQRNVGNKRTVDGNRREEAVITCMRIGHRVKRISS